MKTLFLFFFIIPFLSAQNTEELGEVNWMRNYSEALEQSRKNNKPVLLLFQEVPGCATCKNYGQNVLSNPLVVDVIENYFVPLAIFNNKAGEDKKVLEKYNEPSWNNPVVRIVDSSGADLVSRVSGNYSSTGIVDAMIQSFVERQIQTPQDILLLQDIINTDASSEVTFSMYCFWSGEKAYGKLDGVYGTEAGWQNGKEVVKVTFDESKISKKQIEAQGKIANCADDQIKTGSFKKDKDPKYYLKKSKYRILAMHPLQAARINSLIGNGVSKPDQWLFPSQKKYIEFSEKNKVEESLYDNDFEIAWDQMLFTLK